jgi:VIT1/CCC1 family predicted Fe2+/Mn2+ transporter
MAEDPKTLLEWKHHWRDEADAAFLYRVLAAEEPDARRKDIYARLAAIEDRHVQLWEQLLAQHGVQPGTPRPSGRARLFAWVARRFGPSILLSLLLREEGQEVKGYIDLHRRSGPGVAKDTALTLAQESAEHAETLQGLAGRSGEPWHRTSTGSYLRNVIYGFNDGLTANFGLIAGVIGASIGGPNHFVLVSGLAGMVADALSMGASGYLAAKSEQEVYDHEIAMEREEIRLMPEVEEEELALIYEAKGVEGAQARDMAHDLMQSPERMLDEKVKEELGIQVAAATPLTEGSVTGLATAVGAFLPVLPFLILSGRLAAWAAFTFAMLCHFAVGAARSIFTGRGIIRSGFDMFVVGLGVAAVGYVVGSFITRFL